MDYNYNGYDRGYTEPAMTSADYMNRTYRWMAVGLLWVLDASQVQIDIERFPMEDRYPFASHGGDLLDVVIGNQRAVAGEPDIKTFGFGVMRNLENIGTQQRFATRQGQAPAGAGAWPRSDYSSSSSGRPCWRGFHSCSWSCCRCCCSSFHLVAICVLPPAPCRGSTGSARGRKSDVQMSCGGRNFPAPR